jgi:hypothetical protein
VARHIARNPELERVLQPDLAKSPDCSSGRRRNRNKAHQDARALELLGVAAEAAPRAARLTSQMPIFSRKQDVGLRSVDPNKLLKNLDELLRRTFGGLIHPQCDVAPDIWLVFVDPAQLEVAVLNLDDVMGPTLPGVSRLRQMTQCRWGAVCIAGRTLRRLVEVDSLTFW